MKIPVLTKNRLKHIGIYRKLTPNQRKAMKDGYKIESEHLEIGDKINFMVPYKIAWDHIREHGSEYYTKLKKCKID